MKMLKWLSILLISCTALSACSFTPYSPKIAEIGNAGSTTGPHIIKRMTVTDTNSGRSSFAYGAVSSYPGASADIGRIGIPKKVEGYWSKGWDEYEEYYYISSLIDSKLAENKIDTLRDYYKNHGDYMAAMVLAVDGPRVRLIYTLNCFAKFNDCAPRKNADPNGWVVRSPDDTTEVVVLFDGTGEASDTPFPGSPYDK
ncbi:hypothetical protein [Photobacterium halotolerans]|uniref:hypothetical protein n=1 Tax=Photobacterium halotolerans TaxID=265726 RepID=UPI001929A277|nr:hypothetical protein [Photobacterium halotolerans]